MRSTIAKVFVTQRSVTCLSSSTSRIRNHSSAASALRNDYYDEEDYDKPPRDRLKALRRRLREETSGPTMQTTQAAAQPIKTKVPSQEPMNLQALVDPLPNIEQNKVLTDSFQRQHTYLRLSLTERCNLRCTYCMPEAGVPLQPAHHLLQTPELLRIAKYFRKAGVTKFRLTGGEPSLRHDLLTVVDGLHQLGPDQIGMTSNGIALHKKLPSLVEAGLNSLNISLDTLDPEKFGKLTRRPAAYMDRVWQTLEVAHGLLNVKLNCVVMRGVNDHEVADFINLTDQFPNLAVRFIEYMPFSENGWNWSKCVPYQELLDNLPQDKISPIPAQDPHDTTKWFRTASGGRVGFITSMSSHFCAGCNRLRLSADGQIKVCLFDGHSEISLRDALRDYNFNDEDLGKLIHHAVQKKKFALGGHKDPQDIMNDAANNRPMTLIGG